MHNQEPEPAAGPSPVPPVVLRSPDLKLACIETAAGLGEQVLGDWGVAAGFFQLLKIAGAGGVVETGGASLPLFAIGAVGGGLMDIYLGNQAIERSISDCVR